MNSKEDLIFIQKLLKVFDLKKGDKILINSSLLNTFLKFKKNRINFNPNLIIDNLIDIITDTGTILIPTFNWDFCRGLGFDYYQSKSMSGSLGNVVLKRKDFSRSKNPIFNFCVFGKDREYICNLKHESCFSLDSPFGYLIKNNGKNLFIDIDYKEAFTFVHLAEQQIGVKYRYLKKFSGDYLDKSKKKARIEFEMYVRDRKEADRTTIASNFDKVLIDQNAYQKKVLEGINLTALDIKKTYDLMLEDLKSNNGMIYPEIIKD